MRKRTSLANQLQTDWAWLSWKCQRALKLNNLDCTNQITIFLRGVQVFIVFSLHIFPFDGFYICCAINFQLNKNGFDRQRQRIGFSWRKERKYTKIQTPRFNRNFHPTQSTLRKCWNWTKKIEKKKSFFFFSLFLSFARWIIFTI